MTHAYYYYIPCPAYYTYKYMNLTSCHIQINVPVLQ